MNTRARVCVLYKPISLAEKRLTSILKGPLPVAKLCVIVFLLYFCISLVCGRTLISEWWRGSFVEGDKLQLINTKYDNKSGCPHCLTVSQFTNRTIWLAQTSVLQNNLDQRLTFSIVANLVAADVTPYMTRFRWSSWWIEISVRDSKTITNWSIVSVNLT